MEADLELKAIAKNLEDWRKTRAYKTSKIPVELTLAIKKIGGHYKRHHIAKALKMSDGTVNKILGINTKKIDFVEVLKSEPKPDFFSVIFCTLQRLDGTKLILEVQNHQINDLMQAFLCCK